MTQIADLVTQAQSMGINIFPRDGQVRISMPWSIENIPDPARYLLSEIKKRKEEILVLFAMVDDKPDLQLQLEALRVHGIQLGPDPKNGVKINYTPIPGQNTEVAAYILDRLLRNHWTDIVAHLMVYGQQPAPG